MPSITVSAIITDGDRLLMERGREDGLSRLPGGELLDTDETVEDALVRALEGIVDLPADGYEFLDTVYDRKPDGVTVHNVFMAPDAPIAVGQGDLDTRGLEWVMLEEIEGLPLPTWLAEALPAFLRGEAAPEPELESRFAFMGGTSEEQDTAPVIILTGPAGAGKSTVARVLGGRFERAAIVETDVLGDMIVSGYASPVPGASNPGEAASQIRLAKRNAAALARSFATTGFTAIVVDVLERTGELDAHLRDLAGLDVAFVTLLPDANTVATRDNGRPEENRMGERAIDLHAIFSTNGETRGLRLDTSAWTVEQTVDAVVERLPEAWIYPPASETLDG